MARHHTLAATAMAVAFSFGGSLANAVPLVRSAGGADAAAIAGSVAEYRTDLGTQNANVPGSFADGRREINWDGVPDAFSAPNGFPVNFFNVNSPRGVVFSTPGTGLEVSGDGSPGPTLFSDLNAAYSTTFAFFSPVRLFSPIGSNIVDVSFFVPGEATPALTRGFGAVFTDVDLPSTTSLTFYDQFNTEIGTFFAPAVSGDATLSFLGVSFPDIGISRVRITLGTSPLGPTDQNGNTRDIVALDDFIYGEPQAVPEPASAMFLAGALGTALLRSRKRIK